MKQQIQLIEDIIKSEVNIKSVEFLTETEGFISKKIKANFKALGTRMGARMKSVAAAIGAMSQAEISQLEQNNSFVLQVENDPVEITTAEVDIIAEDIPGWSVANKDQITVALDITVTNELLEEGIARELVNRVQKVRKDTCLEVTDKINLVIQEREELKTAIINYSNYICAEILADRLELIPDFTGGIDIEVNEIPLRVMVEKKG
jgi:isoleucyl-tRNA synthetase